MCLRVVQWSVGGVGQYSLRALQRSTDFDLVGVYRHRNSDIDAVLALRPDCVVYTAVGETRPREAVAELATILRSGANVVSSSMMNLIYPQGAHPSAIETLSEACAAGGSTLFTSGIDPGWSGDALPMAALQICERVDRISVQEIADYGTHADPSWATPYGFGQPEGAPAPILDAGVPTLFWGGMVRMLAEILNVELGGLDEFCDRWFTPTAFDVPIGRIERGTLAAVRFGVAGIVDGEPRLFAEHVTRMRHDMAPEWPQPPTGSSSVHRVDIEGSPSLTLDLCMRSDDGSHTNAGLLATAMRLVNAIPAVVAAPPGMVTPLDLRLGVGRNLLTEAN